MAEWSSVLGETMSDNKKRAADPGQCVGWDAGVLPWFRCHWWQSTRRTCKSNLGLPVSRPRTNIFPYSEQWETSAHLPSILFPLPVLS